MTTSPLVSVIIPTRDRPALLRRALESAVCQTFSNLEILVIDDGSSPPAHEAVVAEPDQRVRLIRHETSRGSSAARNTGLAASTGELIAFLDDDDEWLPGKIARQVDRIREGPGVGFVYCGFEKISAVSGNVESTFRPELPVVDFESFLRRTSFGASIPLVRRDYYVAVGPFDETLVGMEDRDMWLRLARRFTADFVPEVLARYHVHGVQLSTDLHGRIHDNEVLLRKYRDDLRSRPAMEARLWRQLALLQFAAGRSGSARRSLLQAVRREPLNRSSYLHLGASIVASTAHRRFVVSRALKTIEGIALY